MKPNAIVVKVLCVNQERLAGDVVEQVAREWAEQLRGGHKRFVIDFGRVAAMDSQAVGCLLDFYKKTRAPGGQVHLARLQPRIATLLRIVKATGLFGIYASVDEATAAFDDK